jgi:hypothetical protein
MSIRLLVVSEIDQNYQLKGLSNQLTLEVGLPYVSKNSSEYNRNGFRYFTGKMLLPWILCVSEFKTKRKEKSSI